MSREHLMDPKQIHHEWDADLPPVLEIESGDIVHYDLLAAGDRQIQKDDSYFQTKFNFDTMYNLSGPLWIKGAKPGDTLRIDILSLKQGDWGWSAILPNMGLLPMDFLHGYVRTFDLIGDTTQFLPGIIIPLAPFLGTMGNHPGQPRKNLPFPPHRGGGNMDNRHLTVGATLWLPVHCNGAMFSAGDPHAVQGDGEVCVTALECPMRASLRFSLEKRPLSAPSFMVKGPLTPKIGSKGFHATMGINSDLMEGARDAVRAMILWITREFGLTSEDAYLLCSLVGDLKILEIVDSGVWNVAMSMPLSIFQKR